MGFKSAMVDAKRLASALGLAEGDVEKAVKGSRVGGIAKIWSFDDKGTYGRGSISTSSRKEANSETFETTFRDGMVTFFGNAYKKAAALAIPKGGVSIRILDCDVRNRYDSDKKRMYTNYYVFDFDMLDGNASVAHAKPAAAPAPKPAPAPTADNFDEELPF